ncbi:MAG: hypothetical protein AB8B73_11720 [Ekhidna sp.]
MKTRKCITAVVWIALASMVWSCGEDDGGIDPQTPSESSIVKDNILTGSNVAMSRLRGQGFGGPMGAIFGNFYGSIAGRTNTATPLSMMKQNMRGRVLSDSTDTGEDDTPSCLTESWEDDGNGTYSYTLDFGDGCDYYGEFLKGKLEESGTYSETGFSSTTTYTDFGGEDWSIDGTQSYSGTWEESSESDENIEDSIFYHFAAKYEFSADMTQSYMEYDYDSTSDASTEERLVELEYVSQGSESSDELGYTVESRTESMTFNTGESFASSVDAPLYMSNACYEEDVWIYVSGIESGSYTFEGETGAYSINYGDGTCDNLVTITENGVTEEVDLGEIWDDWEEECSGDDHG